MYFTVQCCIEYTIVSFKPIIYLKASIKAVVMLCSCISYCWGSFSSTIHHFSSLPQSVTLACSLPASPWMPIAVLIKVVYCKIKNVSFIFVCLFFMYYLCEKYYKPTTVKYYIANCASWVPRLTLLGLWTNWLMNMPSEQNSFVCRNPGTASSLPSSTFETPCFVARC